MSTTDTLSDIAGDYHRQRLGNCAQSVAHAWAVKRAPDTVGHLERFAGCGGGRAPGGLCGAIHAACELAGPAAAQAIRQAFAERTGGHLTCRAIRSAKRLSCAGCVECAAELLERHAP